LLQRTLERQTFGRYLWQHGATQEEIADSVADLTAARLLTLECAATMDAVGVRAARSFIALIKVAVPQLTYRVVDRAVQVHGGEGVRGDSFLARTLVGLRSLRIADGPDAVHKRTVALLAIQEAKNQQASLGIQSRL
jgi:acyl-CoA dehydrogenase